MKRHELPVRASQVEEISLLAMCENLLQAVQEVQAEGKEPSHDPAVMVLGANLAFMTHADVTSRGMYRDMIERCLAQSESTSRFEVNKQ